MHAPSTLAKSILANRCKVAALLPLERRHEIEDIQEATVGEWIQRSTARLHVFVSTAEGPLVLSLLEAFVQCWLKPLFEGKSFQIEPPNNACRPAGPDSVSGRKGTRRAGRRTDVPFSWPAGQLASR
jgi:hypothetical protein